MNISAVEAWLEQHAGLTAPSLGAGTVARAARDRIEATHCEGVADYLARLATDAAERHALIDRVVVPETWFFRDRAALDELAKHVVETWGPAHPGTVFRVLSVPCSTGEEAYSLAMALALAGWPLARLRIDAVDLSPANLSRAKDGVYGKNSFRGADVRFRDAFMTPAGADTWRVGEAVRAPVTFEQGNLLADDFGAARGHYDAIFCRNLLIYFGRETQDRAIRALARMLAPGAWIAVGPAEPVLLFEHGFSALKIPGAFLLHQAPRRAAPVVAVALPRRAPVAAAPPPSLRPQKIPAPKAPAPAPAATLADLRELADAGRLREAVALGEVLAATEGGVTEFHFLLAVVADAASESARAEALFRKVLYLDPHHAEALSHLALLAEKNGDRCGARTFRERAGRALAREAGV